MALTPGTRLGVYEVTAQIGEGGMGQVYRATDSKLKRQVAIKILPAALSTESDRLARFQREAEVLASLNHPNIAGIYGLEESGGVVALVMELVEGDDLSQRIARGAIPLDEALPIAKQIAEALEAAHGQGIIHRDLKPANIKVRADGTVKVLDFGLAKAFDPTPSSRADATHSPTLSMRATQAGIVLGTVTYMAPEQARGKAVGKRADIWAFGCVLFEMLTGRRPFEGDDVNDTLASVLKSDPEWSALPATVPSFVRVLLEGCLRKDPRQRIADISTAVFLLDHPAPFETTRTGSAALPPRPLWRRTLPVAASALIGAAVAGGGLAWRLTSSIPPPIVTRFAIALGEGQAFTNAGRHALDISPDGTQIAYVANSRLYLRTMSDADARPIRGSESPQGAGGVTNPVFSRDGRFIAFYSLADRTLKRIATTGGAAVTICQADNPYGMSWETNEILIGQGAKGILRVSPSDGKTERLIDVQNGELAHGPHRLPGGDAVLFTLATEGSVSWDTARIVVQSLKSGERKTLLSGGSDARYLPTGHIVYAFGGVVFAVQFDRKQLAIVGSPVPVIDAVRRAWAGNTGAAQFSVAGNGTVVYVPGPAATSPIQQGVAIVDRRGALQRLNLPAAPYEYPRVSPDGTRLAIGTDDGKAATVWIYELGGSRARRQLTFGGRNRHPIWSPDGARVTFQSDREGDLALFWQPADGARAAERLTKPERGTTHIPQSCAPDGRTCLFTVARGSSFSLWALSMPDRRTAPYGGVESPGAISAAFSPDGRWVAYSDAAAGVWVQPFPATGAKYRIGDGIQPFWSPDGRELFFDTRTQLVVTTVGTTPAFTFGTVTEVSRRGIVERGPMFERNVDMMPDGERFVGVSGAEEDDTNASEIRVVEHWLDELKARAPTK